MQNFIVQLLALVMLEIRFLIQLCKQTNEKKARTVLTIQQMLSEIPRYLVPIGDGVQHHRLNQVFAKKLSSSIFQNLFLSL